MTTPSRPAGLRSLKRAVRELVERPRIRNSGAILCYHGVTAAPMPIQMWTQMNAQLFEQHLAYLSKNHECIGLVELIDRLEGDGPVGRPVVITFDDGFENNVSVAVPLLERYRLPATIFVTAGLVGSRELIWSDEVATLVHSTSAESVTLGPRSFPLTDREARERATRSIVDELKGESLHFIDEWLAAARVHLDPDGAALDSELADTLRIMSAEQLDSLADRDLIDVGSHGCRHAILSRIPPEQASREVVESRRALREHGHDSDTFAFPNGTPDDYDASHRRAIVDAGYRCALTTTRGRVRRSDDLWELPRFVLGGSCSVDELRYHITRKA